MDPMTGIEVVGELIMPYLRGIYDDLCQAVQGAALLLTIPSRWLHQSSQRGRACRGSRACWPRCRSSPSMIPRVNAQMPWLHPFLKLSPALSRASIHLVKRLSDRMLRPLYALRAKSGFTAGTASAYRRLHSPSATLALFSKLFVRDQPNWPRQLRVTGFPYHDLRGRPGDPVDLP